VARLWAGGAGFQAWQGQEIFIFSKAFRLALLHTQSPIKWLPGTVSQG